MEKIFEVDQFELVDNAKAIIKTIPDKAIIPANEYVHLQSFDGELMISASNTENTTRLVLESAVFDNPFDICIDHSFLKPLNKREIPLTFSMNDNRCIITCKDSKWEIPAISPKDFVELDKEWEPFFEIESDILKDTLRKVSPFTYQDQGTSISKIHFKSTEEYLCIGSSNHFSCCLNKIFRQFDKEISFLISRETANLICDIAIGDTVNIFKHEDGSMKFESLDRSVATVGHAFEGNPVNDYASLAKRYLERDHDIITIIDKEYFADQVKKAVAFSPFDMKALLIHILDGRLMLEVEDYISHKRSIQELEVLLSGKGDVTLMGLPYDHLVKILSCIKSESIELEIPLSHGAGMTCIKEPVLIQDGGFIYMVMPLTV